jgi:chromate transport protein ChrA
MVTKANPTKRLFFNALGLAVSIIPVTAAILSYFPIWARRADSSILSGISLVLVAIALVPLYKHVRAALRSPSAPMMWLFSFLVFLLLSRIADEMTVISFVGFVTNVLGSLCFKRARMYASEVKDE